MARRVLRIRGRGCHRARVARERFQRVDGDGAVGAAAALGLNAVEVLARALERTAVDEARRLRAVSPDETRSRGLAHIDSLGGTSKAARMCEVFTAYMDGQGVKEVMASTGASRGAVSGYLNEIESATGCTVVRGPAGASPQSLNHRGVRRITE